jgi:hypothetical protein
MRAIMVNHLGAASPSWAWSGFPVYNSDRYVEVAIQFWHIGCQATRTVNGAPYATNDRVASMEKETVCSRKTASDASITSLL